MDDKTDKVSAKMHAKDRGVIGMKIYGGWGYGPQNRKQRFESLKHVLGLGTVHAFTIGFSKIEHPGTHPAGDLGLRSTTALLRQTIYPMIRGNE